MASFSRYGLPRRGSGRNLTEQEHNEDLEKLLVFGYESKIFRDDERAVFIEEGRHLIPWMGDSSLLIDRYDGRGHLHDLKPYDADLSGNHGYEMTDEEEAVEAACDEQRYLELNPEYMEKLMYEEEEEKRLNQDLEQSGYGAVGFSYDAPQDQQQTNHDDNDDDDDDFDDEPYTPAEELQVPEGVAVPATIKVNAVIEKTAAFLAKHGAQMEIMIKTKQKDNPMFNFLNYGDELNAYYKHVMKMIKLGRYTPQSPRKREDSGTYLHPSLVKTQPEPASTTTLTNSKDFLKKVREKLPAGQIANTPYAKLLSNLSKHTGRNSPSIDNMGIVGQAPPVASRNNPYPENYGYPQPQADLPPVPGMEPVTLPPAPLLPPARPAQPPPPGVGGAVGGVGGVGGGLPGGPLPGALQQLHRSLEADIPPGITVPAPDTRPIVDKMANYVAKNGPEFEVIVRAKNDERFQFLNKSHPLHQYYVYKRELYTQEQNEEEDCGNHGNQDSSSRDSRAVAFRVKTKEAEPSSLVTRTALVYESSGEEEEPSDVTDTGTNQEAEHSVTSSADAEKKQAEERLRDKLALAARDKLTQANKEKQLQAERKRKAAMFISMLKGGDEETDAQGIDDGQSSPVIPPPGLVQIVPPAVPPGVPTVPGIQGTALGTVPGAVLGTPVVVRSVGGAVPGTVPGSVVPGAAGGGTLVRSIGGALPLPQGTGSTGTGGGGDAVIGPQLPNKPTTPLRSVRSKSKSPQINRSSPVRRNRSRSRSPHRRKKPRRSRSRSRSRKSPAHARRRRTRSRSRSRSRRKRSRSRSRNRKSKRRSRSRSPKSKSKKSKSRKRSRSRSKERRRRSRSRDRRRRSKSRERKRKSRSKSRTRENSKRSRTRSPSVEVINAPVTSGPVTGQSSPDVTITHTEREPNSGTKAKAPPATNSGSSEPVPTDLMAKVRAMLKASRESALEAL